MQVGISAWVVTLPESVSQEKMEETVRQVCGDKLVDGVLLQLPLPHQLDEDAIIECFDPDKDVDGFHPLNIGYEMQRHLIFVGLSCKFLTIPVSVFLFLRCLPCVKTPFFQ